MAEEMYALTEDPNQAGAYSYGPTPDLQNLLDVPSPEAGAEIHLLDPDCEKPTRILYRWVDVPTGDDMAWAASMAGGQPYEVPEAVPFVDETDERRKIVLDAMNLSGDENEVMMVSCKVAQFTLESTVQPAAYESARAYVNLEPDDLWLHIPIRNPGQKVTTSGNAEILGGVIRYLGRELDRAVFRVASERADTRAIEADKTAAKKGGVKIGQGTTPQAEPAKSEPTEIL